MARHGHVPRRAGRTPTSTRPARIVAYNLALREEALARGWAHEGGALFARDVEPAHFPHIDAFHPSLAGQAALA